MVQAREYHRRTFKVEAVALSTGRFRAEQDSLQAKEVRAHQTDAVGCLGEVGEGRYCFQNRMALDPRDRFRGAGSDSLGRGLVVYRFKSTKTLVPADGVQTRPVQDDLEAVRSKVQELV